MLRSFLLRGFANPLVSLSSPPLYKSRICARVPDFYFEPNSLSGTIRLPDTARAETVCPYAWTCRSVVRNYTPWNIETLPPNQYPRRNLQEKQHYLPCQRCASQLVHEIKAQRTWRFGHLTNNRNLQSPRGLVVYINRFHLGISHPLLGWTANDNSHSCLLRTPRQQRNLLNRTCYRHLLLHRRDINQRSLRTSFLRLLPAPRPVPVMHPPR